MAWQPDYVTTAELKTYLGISDAADDTALGTAITAASRAVDRVCNRQFGVVASAEARYYVWDGAVFGRSKRPFISIDDLQSLTNLAVGVDNDNDEVWESVIVNDTDFDLWPYNAVAIGKPWTHLILRSGGSVISTFPIYERSIKVTGIFGWTAVPTTVKQAVLIQANRFFQRKHSPYGIAGSPDTGSELRLLDRVDPDVAMMLKDYRRVWGAV